MSKMNLWPLAYETLHALEHQYRPAMDKAAKQAGFDPKLVGTLLNAYVLAPRAISTWRLHTFIPYTAARRHEERLRAAAWQGYLKAMHEGEYRLTELGERAVRNVIDAANKAMGKLKPLPQEDLQRLADMLLRLVDACSTAPEPPAKLSIGLSRRLDAAPDAPLLAKVEQYLSDLNGYRDDAHMAAWQPTELSGPAWEALTLIWRKEASSVDDLLHKLEYRGHTREDYEEALNDLVQRNLIQEAEGKYTMTEPGIKLRQKAEEKTDTYFYAPWKCLKTKELEELERLLERLRDGLTQPAHEAVPA